MTGLFYKTGEVTTGIEIVEIRPQSPEQNILDVLTDFRRTGNSPFLGTITTQLLNQNGEVLTQRSLATSYYFDGTTKQTLDISGIAPGEYSIRVTFIANRSDIPNRDLIPMDPVSRTIPFTIR